MHSPFLNRVAVLTAFLACGYLPTPKAHAQQYPLVVFMGGTVDAVAIPDTLEWTIWDGREYVRFGRPRAVVVAPDSARATWLPRAGFHNGAPLYARPENLPRPGILYRLNENGRLLLPLQSVECAGTGEAAVVVEVLDARTEQPPTRGATLVVREGVYSDSMSRAAPWEGQGGAKELLLSGATERSGTYDLDVRSPGYHSWRAGNVGVNRGRCGVEPVRLRVYLEPREEHRGNSGSAE